MRAECSCGIRHRVTAAQCGGSIQCGCGKAVHIPSLRQLRLSSAEHLIVQQFDDPKFWSRNGCYLCGGDAEQPLGLVLELTPPEYAEVIIGPERRSLPLIHTLVSVFLGRLGGLAVLAADAATQKTETVLYRDGQYLETILYCCAKCRDRVECDKDIADKLEFESFIIELKEDYPSARVFKLVKV